MSRKTTKHIPQESVKELENQDSINFYRNLTNLIENHLLLNKIELSTQIENLSKELKNSKDNCILWKSSSDINEKRVENLKVEHKKETKRFENALFWQTVVGLGTGILIGAGIVLFILL